MTRTSVRQRGPRHADRGQGPQRPRQRRATRTRGAQVPQGRRPGVRPGPDGGRVARGAQSRHRGFSGRFGDALPQGRHAARRGRLARAAPFDQVVRAGARASGQAPPRQAAPPPRGARGARRALRAASAGRCNRRANAAGETRRVGTLQSYGDPRPSPASGRSQAVQAVRKARRAHQRLRARDGARGLRRAAGSDGRPARAGAQRREARRPAARDLRDRARGRQARDGHAPFRRAADRRHGPAFRLDRRDAHRRGQDPHRDAAGRAELAARHRRAPRDGQRLPRPPRRGVDVADLQGARHAGRRPAEHAGLRGEARRLRRRRHVRHELGVRLRLPARQHGDVAGGEGPARPSLRDRRRGRQHPHRRGAHAADHLRPARGRGRHVRHVRQARQADGPRQEARGHGPAHEEGLRGRLRLRVRGEAQDRLGQREGRRQGGEVPRHPAPLPRRERPARQPPAAGAEGRVAVQARRRLRRHRRRGEDHRRVHRPHPRGPALVGGPAPGRRGEGGRARPGGEPDARDDHAAELLPPLREARGHDRYRPHRGDRVHEDLQAVGRRDPHEPQHGPPGQERSGLQDQGRQVGRRQPRDHRAPHERASRCSSARSPSRSPSCSPRR